MILSLTIRGGGLFAILAFLSVIAWSVACRDAQSSGTSKHHEPPATDGPTSPVPTSGDTRPRDARWSDARQRMVYEQLVARGIRDVRVVQAMTDVPRHWFVPEHLSGSAYDDRPLPIGFEQTISQPYIVALMTELAALRPGDRVLEIGTGSGFQAAVLSEITPHVYTIEIVEPLALRTIELLREKGYATIQTRIGDGYRGWPEEAPFDAILVTCGAPRPPPALIEQLKTGGRMVIPVGDSPWNQELLLYSKRADGSLDQRSVAPVAFVPMTGEARKTSP